MSHNLENKSDQTDENITDNIELEEDISNEPDNDELYADEAADEDLEMVDISSSDEDEDGEEAEEKKRSKSKFIHIGFAALVVIIIGVMALVIHKWNQGKELEFTEADLEKQKNKYWDTESLDFPIFYDPNRNEGYVDDGQFNIILLGDESVGNVDDADSLAGKVKKITGANVMTASYEGMTFSINDKSYTTEHPEDAFSMFYFLTCLVNNDYYLEEQALEALGDSKGKKYSDFLYWARYLDYSSADIIIISCGRHDYTKGRRLEGDDKYSEQPFGTPDSISGAMDASLRMLRNAYPNAQVIVSSPTFFLVTDANGDKVGADLQNYGNGGLGEYVVNMANVAMEESVTFVDNYFGLEFNSTNYEGYLLEDGKSVNAKAAEMIANHLEKYFYYNL